MDGKTLIESGVDAVLGFFDGSEQIAVLANVFFPANGLKTEFT